MITTLLLGEIRRSRKERLADFKEVEVLSVAQMALQTGQNHLEANGIQVQVEKDADQLTVYHQGKVVLHGIKERSRPLPCSKPWSLSWCSSGGVLVFQGLTKLLHTELDYQAHQKQEEWVLFQQQLQVELDRSHFEKVADNHIYLVQDQNQLRNN